MEYRRLGSSGVKVSEISLGSWLTYGGSVAEEQARSCINRAYEIGINFFDTANVYMRGVAEEIVGLALREFERDSYFLATKVYFPMGEGPNDRGLSRKHVTEQCHASLRRLGVDYIDLYQCHRYDENTPLEETMRALDDLVRQGKVLYIGVSEWTADQRTILRSSRMRSRSASPICLTRTPESVSVTALNTFWAAVVFPTSLSSLAVKASKVFPRSLFIHGWRLFRAIGFGETMRDADAPSSPLEGRSGQGRSREPSCKGDRSKTYVMPFHTRNATTSHADMEGF